MTKQLTKRVLSAVLAVLMLFATAAPVLAKMGTGDMPFFEKGNAAGADSPAGRIY